VLGISGPAITPTDDVDNFQEVAAFAGVTPGSTHANRFCVLLEPIESGFVGRAVLSGATVARVNVGTGQVGAGLQYAQTISGDATKLQLASSGPAQVLWVDDAAGGVRWALLRLGTVPAAAAVGITIAEADGAPSQAGCTN